MLKHLQKFFSGEPEQSAQATTEEVVSMTTEKDQVALATDITTAELTAQLSTVTEAMTTLQAEFAELSTKYAAAEAALTASAQAQEMLISQAKAAKMEARTASLSAVMGDVKGPQMAVALESLGDDAFATVLSGYAASFEAESKSEMFSEKGVSAEAAPVVEEDTATRLAASLAATFKTK